MTKYLYNYKFLYPIGAPQEEVDELTLECHSIESAGRDFIGGESWKFKVVGRGDQWFCTSYHWALVENTQENLDRIMRFEAIQEKRRVLQKTASALYNKWKTIKSQ